MHSNSQTKKVLDFLRRNAPQSYNAKTISKCLHIPEKTVKVCLYRLFKKDKIIRYCRGFYQANIDISLLHKLENPPTTLHGIMLECKTTKTLQKVIDGIPSKQYTDEAVMLFDSLGFLPATNYRYYRDLWYEGRKITITVQLKGKVDIHISSSDNPLIYPDFLKMLDFLNGFLERIAPFGERKVVQLLEVGLAKDFRQLRLDGVKSVTLKVFTNAWGRIYYKDDLKMTRFEHHLVSKMSLDDALRSLSILTNPVNYVVESRPDDPNNPSYG